MRVVFRTDASHQIGTGHVMRCLTLAHALRERGAECRFICREHPGHLLGLIRGQGFEAVALACHAGQRNRPGHAQEPALAHAEWLGTDWPIDAEATRDALGETIADWLVVDHYALDARWETALRPHCRKILVIDDLADREHDCDLLLDQNLVANMEHRYDGKLPEHCGRLLGPQYALLQPQYAELHPRTPPREGPIGRVLVYFGGADTDNQTGLAIAAFQSLQRDDVMLDVVINPSSPHAWATRQQVQGIPNATLHTGLPSLAPLMVPADLSIGAGGVTSWERCCLGLPTLVITLAENQKPIAAELHRRRLIRWLGHNDEVSEQSLADGLADLLDRGLKADWSEGCQRLVDGRGTERVRSLLLLGPETPLRARLARLDDEALILRWANDPLVRKNAFTTGAIDPDTHRAWFRKRLRDLENCRLYVVETDEGLPVGQVRFDRPHESWDLHYVVDSRARTKNIGRQLVETAVRRLRWETDEAVLFGQIKGDHGVSERAAEDLGLKTGSCPSKQALSITVCSDRSSWINASLPDLLLGWLCDGHRVVWTHQADELPGGDLCFYLSYGRIVDAEVRSRYRHNLVVHASDLPHGRGWSPASWLILEGAEHIPVTLFEAVDHVDAGPIYLQDWISLEGTELSGEWRTLLAAATLQLARSFVDEYPRVLNGAREQSGVPTIYPRRRAQDSRLDEARSLADQFNALRVVDNESYPAFVVHKGKKFVIRIYRQ